MNTDKIELHGWQEEKMNFALEEFAKQNRKFSGISGADFCETELERKFIIMSRISVALWRKGIASCVNMHQDGFCAITVMLGSYKGESFNHDYVTSHDATEAELLEWWVEVEK